MSRRPKFPRSVWENLDWNRTALEIAEELGVPTQMVYIWARKMNKKPLPKAPGPPSAIDWDSLDWSKSNQELGKELGVSRLWVLKMRQRRFSQESA